MDTDKAVSKEEILKFSTKILRKIAKDANIPMADKMQKRELITSIYLDIVQKKLDSAFDRWKKLIAKEKKFNYWFYGVMLLGALLTAIFSINDYRKNLTEAELFRQEDIELNNRIVELDEVEKSLENLIEYIKYKKESLIETEKSINELEKKESELKPLVDAKMEVIDSLFLAQEKRYQKKRWWDRLYGFIASLFASGIILLLTSRKREPPNLSNFQ